MRWLAYQPSLAGWSLATSTRCWPAFRPMCACCVCLHKPALRCPITGWYSQMVWIGPWPLRPWTVPSPAHCCLPAGVPNRRANAGHTGNTQAAWPASWRPTKPAMSTCRSGRCLMVCSGKTWSPRLHPQQQSLLRAGKTIQPQPRAIWLQPRWGVFQPPCWPAWHKHCSKRGPTLVFASPRGACCSSTE